MNFEGQNLVTQTFWKLTEIELTLRFSRSEFIWVRWFSASWSLSARESLCVSPASFSLFKAACSSKHIENKGYILKALSIFLFLPLCHKECISKTKQKKCPAWNHQNMPFLKKKKNKKKRNISIENYFHLYAWTYIHMLTKMYRGCRNIQPDLQKSGVFFATQACCISCIFHDVYA